MQRGATFDDYGPAYGLGVKFISQYPGRTLDDIEPEMARSWTQSRGPSRLDWDSARHAVLDAWHRVNGSS